MQSPPERTIEQNSIVGDLVASIFEWVPGGGGRPGWTEEVARPLRYNMKIHLCILSARSGAVLWVVYRRRRKTKADCVRLGSSERVMLAWSLEYGSKVNRNEHVGLRVSEMLGLCP